MRIGMAVVLCSAIGGCAYTGPRAQYSELAGSYRAVRSGAQTTATADRVRFCAAGDGVRARRTWSESYDGWIDKFRDEQLAESVRQVLRRDPDLAGQAIEAQVDKGEVRLTGQVPTDEVAVRAARAVMDIAGVIFVDVQLTSAESPSTPRLAQVPYQECG
jgi:osmotically-inducible protein OsmY